MDGESALLLLVALGAVAAGAVGAALLLRRGGTAGGLESGLAALQAEVRGVGERVLALERVQGRVQEGVAALGTGLARADTVARTLGDTTAAIREELSRARQDLTAMQAQAAARRELEQRTAESIRRLETIIAGTQSKGAAGEQILEAVFARLPVEWQARDFRVGDKVVEFGLRLPNSLVLPIDSKWPATDLLERFAACEDAAEQQRLRGQIEAAVLGRAREVRKYLDPSVTASFGVAAVPDAAYELCWGVQADLFQEGVVLVSYSLFVPYLLLVFQMALRTSQQIDVQRLDAYLQSAGRSLTALQEELDGRFARAVTMLQNSRIDMGVHLGKVTSGLAGLRLGAGGGGAGGPAAVEAGEPVAADADAGS